MPWKQSFARWCFAKTPIEPLCEIAKSIGFAGIDLVDPSDWETLRRCGLVCSLCPSHSIVKGLNDPAHHPACEKAILDAIDISARHGCPNVVCFSGNRGAIDDVRGAGHCVDALRRLAPAAEAKGITLCLELLNSKDHRDYMCDRTRWGVEVCERVGSARVKLLYDVYHMQRMEGDLVSTISASTEWIGHLHTAGVPGRGELDEQQEIHYPAVFAALRRAGYGGWIGHEFLPKGDAEAGLRQAYALTRETGET